MRERRRVKQFAGLPAGESAAQYGCWLEVGTVARTSMMRQRLRLGTRKLLASAAATKLRRVLCVVMRSVTSLSLLIHWLLVHRQLHSSHASDSHRHWTRAACLSASLLVSPHRIATQHLISLQRATPAISFVSARLDSTTCYCSLSQLHSSILTCGHCHSSNLL